MYGPIPPPLSLLDDTTLIIFVDFKLRSSTSKLFGPIKLRSWCNVSPFDPVATMCSMNSSDKGEHTTFLVDSFRRIYAATFRLISISGNPYVLV